MSGPGTIIAIAVVTRNATRRWEFNMPAPFSTD
jgi:hypothetical protein